MSFRRHFSFEWRLNTAELISADDKEGDNVTVVCAADILKPGSKLF